MDPQHRLVHLYLEQSADRAASAPALVHGDRSWSYGQIEEQANRLAQLLIARGIRPGDRVGLLTDNGIEAVSGVFGIQKAGACVVSLNHANRAGTHHQLLADSGAKALVTRALAVRRDLPQIVAGLDSLELLVLDRAGPQPGPDSQLAIATAADVGAMPSIRPGLDLGPDDLAQILYTSGSTGRPRGAVLTHGNLTANAEQILGYLDLDRDDSSLVVLPFHYSFGNSLLTTHFAVGASLVLDNRFAYPQAVMDTLREREVTSFSGVPSTYAILAAKTDFLKQPPASLRMLTQAGGGMAPSLIRRVHEAFRDHARLFIMYGQTEASARLSYVPAERLEEKIGSIGIPIPGVELVLRREDGSECGVGEVGELTARGGNIMRGYWNDPQETEKVLRDGELRTGDLGRRDDDGYIWLVDRIKHMIKAGANRVSSREVEDAIAGIEGVVEVCVVGVEDELLGEAIEAHVAAVEQAGLDERTILANLHTRLAPFKIPRKIIFHNELPKNSSGKINKNVLKNIK